MGPVEKYDLTSLAINGNTAPGNAPIKPLEQTDPPVNSVGSHVVLDAIGSAQNPVQPSSRCDHQLCLGVTSIEKPRPQIQIHNLVPAGPQANTGITQTTLNPKSWCGCAPPVISSTTTLEPLEDNDFAQTARFKYAPKASAHDRLAYLTCTDSCPAHDTVVPAKEAKDRAPNCPLCNQPREVYQHPTVKPYGLAIYHAKLLSLPPHTNPIAIVPFCGTGIEAKALLDVGFRVIAIDIDPRHVAMTQYRLGGVGVTVVAVGDAPPATTTTTEVPATDTTSFEDLLGL